MFSQPKKETGVEEALKISDILQLYFSNLPLSDLLASGQVNRNWMKNANAVFERQLAEELQALDKLEDKKICAQMIEVAPLFIRNMLLENQDSKEAGKAFKELADLIRAISENSQTSPASIIKHFATTERCYHFSHEDTQEYALMLELPVLLNRLFAIDYQAASRIVNFIQASNMAFPLQLLCDDQKMMEKFIKLTQDHKLSFINGYMLLYFRMAIANSAWGKENPKEDCDKALDYINSNMAESVEILKSIKTSFSEIGLGDDITNAFEKMDGKNFDYLLAGMILGTLRSNNGSNNALILALSDVAKSKDENILITLRSVVGLLRNNDNMSNAEILATFENDDKKLTRK